MNSSERSGEPPEFSRWTAAACVLVAVLFCIAFFRQQLPNNPTVNRTNIWTQILDDVLLTNDAQSDIRGDGNIPIAEALRQRIPMAAVASLLIALAWMTGALTVRLSGTARLFSPPELLAVQLGAGLSWLSLTTLIAGLTGLLRPWILAMPSLCSAVALMYVSRTSRHSSDVAQLSATPASLGQISPRYRSWWTWLFLASGLLWLMYLFVAAMSPPFDFDVREYHLQGPKEWFQAERIFFLRHNVYTSFPFLTEMLSLSAMVLMDDWWAGALAGKLVLAVFAPLTTLCVYSIVARYVGRAAAIAASVIHLTVPWTLRISMIAYAEGGLTFFLAVTCMCLLRLRDTTATEDAAGSRFVLGQHNGFLFLTGLLSGSAMACKYTGLVSVVLPTLLAIIVAQATVGISTPPSIRSRSTGRGLRRATQSCLVFAVGLTLAVGPWLVRNLMDTGNPVYPLAWRVFGGSEWSPEIDIRWKAAHSPGEHQISRIPQHFLDVALRNDWTSPLLFALAIPSLLLTWHWRKLRVIWFLIAWQFVTWWSLTHRIDRFWIPAIPLLAVAAGWTWKLSSSRMWRSGMLTVLAVGTIFNIRFCTLPLTGFHAGLMDLEVARRIPIRSDIQTLNRSLPSDALVLMVGEAEVFDARFPLLYNTVFDDSLFEQWFSEPQSSDLRDADSIRRTLRDAGVTHVMVNWLEILRYRLPGSYGYTPFVQPAVFTELVQQGILLPPEVHLSKRLSAFSEQELSVLTDWPGSQTLMLPGRDEVAGVLLYEVPR